MSNYRMEAPGQLLRREANKQKGTYVIAFVTRFSFTEGHPGIAFRIGRPLGERSAPASSSSNPA
jgi:hypothetical protein